MSDADTPAVDTLALGGRIIPGDPPCLLCQARASAVCSVLQDEQADCLKDLVVRRRIDPGSRLFDEGDWAAHYFIVTQGAMMVSRKPMTAGARSPVSCIPATCSGSIIIGAMSIPPKR